MSQQSLFEKLQLKDEKNLLIQGIPSSIEKQFSKLSFSKNVTPLLKTRRVEFALIFVVNQLQLDAILKEVVPVLNSEAKFWVSYPKSTSKIVTDLYKSSCWSYLIESGYKAVDQIEIDHVWTATQFRKLEILAGHSSPLNSTPIEGAHIKSRKMISINEEVDKSVLC